MFAKDCSTMAAQERISADEHDPATRLPVHSTTPVRHGPTSEAIDESGKQIPANHDRGVVSEEEKEDDSLLSGFRNYLVSDSFGPVAPSPCRCPIA